MTRHFPQPRATTSELLIAAVEVSRLLELMFRAGPF